MKSFFRSHLVIALLLITFFGILYYLDITSAQAHATLQTTPTPQGITIASPSPAVEPGPSGDGIMFLGIAIIIIILLSLWLGKTQSKLEPPK